MRVIEAPDVRLGPWALRWRWTRAFEGVRRVGRWAFTVEHARVPSRRWPWER